MWTTSPWPISPIPEISQPRRLDNMGTAFCEEYRRRMTNARKWVGSNPQPSWGEPGAGSICQHAPLGGFRWYISPFPWFRRFRDSFFLISSNHALRVREEESLFFLLLHISLFGLTLSSEVLVLTFYLFLFYLSSFSSFAETSSNY